MVQVDRVLCLVSLPPASSGALQQGALIAAARGGGAREAMMHVVSLGNVDRSALDEAVQNQIDPSENAVIANRHDPLPESSEASVQPIQRYVEEIDADLLVLDPPPDRGPVPLLADDWTRPFVERLDCPLFGVQGAREPASIQRILVPTDLSDPSVGTLKHAIDLASFYDASILLLHVINTSPYVALTPVDRLLLGRTTLSEHRARRRLQQFVEEGRSADVSVSPRLAFGKPADRIAHVVQEEDVDLLVLAAHETQSPPEQSLGRVSSRVLRRVTCPLFLVRSIE